MRPPLDNICHDVVVGRICAPNKAATPVVNRLNGRPVLSCLPLSFPHQSAMVELTQGGKEALDNLIVRFLV